MSNHDDSTVIDFELADKDGEPHQPLLLSYPKKNIW